MPCTSGHPTHRRPLGIRGRRPGATLRGTPAARVEIRCDEQALDKAPDEHLAAKQHRIMPRPVDRARLRKMIAAGREKELAQLASTT